MCSTIMQGRRKIVQNAWLYTHVATSVLVHPSYPCINQRASWFRSTAVSELTEVWWALLYLPQYHFGTAEGYTTFRVDRFRAGSPLVRTFPRCAERILNEQACSQTILLANEIIVSLLSWQELTMTERGSEPDARRGYQDTHAHVYNRQAQQQRRDNIKVLFIHRIGFVCECNL